MHRVSNFFFSIGGFSRQVYNKIFFSEFTFKVWLRKSLFFRLAILFKNCLFGSKSLQYILYFNYQASTGFQKASINYFKKENLFNNSAFLFTLILNYFLKIWNYYFLKGVIKLSSKLILGSYFSIEDITETKNTNSSNRSNIYKPENVGKLVRLNGKIHVLDSRVFLSESYCIKCKKCKSTFVYIVEPRTKAISPICIRKNCQSNKFLLFSGKEKVSIFEKAIFFNIREFSRRNVFPIEILFSFGFDIYTTPGLFIELIGEIKISKFSKGVFKSTNKHNFFYSFLISRNEQKDIRKTIFSQFDNFLFHRCDLKQVSKIFSTSMCFLGLLNLGSKFSIGNRGILAFIVLFSQGFNDVGLIFREPIEISVESKCKKFSYDFFYFLDFLNFTLSNSFYKFNKEEEWKKKYLQKNNLEKNLNWQKSIKNFPISEKTIFSHFGADSKSKSIKRQGNFIRILFLGIENKIYCSNQFSSEIPEKLGKLNRLVFYFRVFPFNTNSKKKKTKVRIPTKVRKINILPNPFKFQRSFPNNLTRNSKKFLKAKKVRLSIFCFKICCVYIKKLKNPLLSSIVKERSIRLYNLFQHSTSWSFSKKKIQILELIITLSKCRAKFDLRNLVYLSDLMDSIDIISDVFLLPTRKVTSQIYSQMLDNWKNLAKNKIYYHKTVRNSKN